MSQYLWRRPLKCLECMTCFESTADNSAEVNQRLLFEKVSSGDIAAMFNDVEVPPEHIGAYLALYDAAYSDQDPFTVPPDMLLNYVDLCTVFDQAKIGFKKRGRPRKSEIKRSEDYAIACQMHRMLSGAKSQRQAESPAQAARLLVQSGCVQGSGTPESIAKRLVRNYKRYFSD